MITIPFIPVFTAVVILVLAAHFLGRRGVTQLEVNKMVLEILIYRLKERLSGCERIYPGLRDYTEMISEVEMDLTEGKALDASLLLDGVLREARALVALPPWAVLTDEERVKGTFES